MVENTQKQARESQLHEVSKVWARQWMGNNRNCYNRSQRTRWKNMECRNLKLCQRIHEYTKAWLLIPNRQELPHLFQEKNRTGAQKAFSNNNQTSETAIIAKPSSKSFCQSRNTNSRWNTKEIKSKTRRSETISITTSRPIKF